MDWAEYKAVLTLLPVWTTYRSGVRWVAVRTHGRRIPRPPATERYTPGWTCTWGRNRKTVKGKGFYWELLIFNLIDHGMTEARDCENLPHSMTGVTWSRFECTGHWDISLSNSYNNWSQSSMVNTVCKSQKLSILLCCSVWDERGVINQSVVQSESVNQSVGQSAGQSVDQSVGQSVDQLVSTALTL